MSVTDVDCTGLEVQRALQEFYGSGEAGHGTLQVSDVTFLGRGYETDVFAFSLTADGEGAGEARDLVLRVYAGEVAAEKSAREFSAMGRLREAGYPVPRVLALGRDRLAGDRRPLLGRQFLVMERIHGVPLEWEDRRPETQALFCRLMAELHALNGSDILPDSPLASSRDPYGAIDRELSTLAALLSRLETSEPPSLRDALAWLRARRSAVPCERLVVLHGDFHRNNILLRADGAPFVIDWSNVRLGDCRSDLAWARLLTRAAAQPDRGEAELLLYEQYAGNKVSMIEYFEVASCIRLLLSVLNSLRFGAARQGMRPGAEALMRADPDYMRYVAARLQELTGRTMPDLEDALSALLG
jgi:aminoglycoside phosphotransferase (APT) family kinase protein